MMFCRRINFEYQTRQVQSGFILHPSANNDIIWYKPNSLLSSVKDRLTNTTSMSLNFVKNKKYYYNLDAIRVPHKAVTIERVKRYIENKEHYNPSKHKIDPKEMRQPPTKVLENSAKSGLNTLGKNPGDVCGVSIQEDRAQSIVLKPKHVKGRYHHPRGKNPGDFWIINTKGFKEAHLFIS